MLSTALPKVNEGVSILSNKDESNAFLVSLLCVIKSIYDYFRFLLSGASLYIIFARGNFHLFLIIADITGKSNCFINVKKKKASCNNPHNPPWCQGLDCGDALYASKMSDILYLIISLEPSTFWPLFVRVTLYTPDAMRFKGTLIDVSPGATALR